MTYTPIAPFSGLSGWSFLKRTLPQQKAAYERSPTIKRDEDYFRAKIGSVKTAEQLVSDRRLLSISLGAFGLEADINNKYFIRKILEDGTLKSGTLSGKLANKQYQAMSATFGFGDFATPRTQISTFADKIISAYKARQFETAVGNQNANLRLALNAERELPQVAAKLGSDDGKWFNIMGNVPLRTVFEKALGLPSSFSSLDLDRQLVTLKSRAQRSFGKDTVDQFANPETVEKLLRQFLLRSEVQSASAVGSGPATALILLQGRGVS